MTYLRQERIDMMIAKTYVIGNNLVTLSEFFFSSCSLDNVVKTDMEPCNKHILWNRHIGTFQMNYRILQRAWEVVRFHVFV